MKRPLRGLGSRQRRVLAELWHHPEQTAAGLSGCAPLADLRGLERRGLVRRDRRSERAGEVRLGTRWALTQAGRAAARIVAARAPGARA